jgi:hypothetical protein
MYSNLRFAVPVSPAVLVLLTSVAAGQPFPLPVPSQINIIPQRVVLADIVVMGKVSAIEDQRVATTGFPNLGGIKVAYKVARVMATDVLRGPKDLAKRAAPQVRVGFLPDPDLTVGHEACFLLLKHPKADLFVPMVPQFGCPPASVFIDKNSPNFKDQLALIRRCARLLADPAAGLKAKDLEDRFLTAAMLVIRYRTRPGDGSPLKAEPIDAAQSKQILEALRDADWTKKYPDTWLTPSAVFNHLGPRTYNASSKGADPRKWLRENAAIYRIERLVREAKN